MKVFKNLSPREWLLILGTTLLVCAFIASALICFWPPVWGDVNQDKKLTTADVEAATDFILCRRCPSIAELNAADVNEDGRLSSSDLTIMAREIEKK